LGQPIEPGPAEHLAFEQLQAIDLPFNGAFAAAAESRAEALIVTPDSFLHNHHTQIIALAQRHRLPGMYPDPEYVRAGA
jgi:hypothetical protein